MASGPASACFRRTRSCRTFPVLESQSQPCSLPDYSRRLRPRQLPQSLGPPPPQLTPLPVKNKEEPELLLGPATLSRNAYCRGASPAVAGTEAVALVL